MFMPKRKQISTTDRIFYALDREKMWLEQGKKCKYCKKRISKKEATLDHVVPLSYTRYHSLNNCVVACYDCNQEKADNMDWKPEMEEQAEWEYMIEDWKNRMDERMRRFEFSFALDTKGGYNKWVKYWEKRGKWD